jgi:PRTRC genetic system protein E
MFAELQELLKKRSLLLTITAGENDIMRVTVKPNLKDDEPKALATPFVLDGTAAELDEGFAAGIGEYTSTHQSLEEQLATIKTEMDDAVKVAKKEAADKVKAASAATKTKPAPTAKKPEPAKVEAKEPPAEPPAPSLFDAAPAVDNDAPAEADATEQPTDAAPASEPEVKEDTADGAETQLAAA